MHVLHILQMGLHTAFTENKQDGTNRETSRNGIYHYPFKPYKYYTSNFYNIFSKTFSTRMVYLSSCIASLLNAHPIQDLAADLSHIHSNIQARSGGPPATL